MSTSSWLQTAAHLGDLAPGMERDRHRGIVLSDFAKEITTASGLLQSQN
jgi:hypothetical protein